MGLNAVIGEIINRSEAESLSIQRQGKKEATSILKSAKDKIEIKKKAALEKSRSFADALERKDIASAKLMNKRLELDAKREVIEKVYLNVNEKIRCLEDETRKSMLKKLLEKASGETKPKYIYTNKRDSAHAKKIAKNLEHREADILGGIIVENASREIRIDYSFDTIVESVKESTLSELSKRLFK